MELSQLIDILGENTTITLAGLLIGTLFGLFAQRSRFCMRSAVVEFWNRQGTAKLAIWLCAFSSAVIATQLFIALGWLDVSQARQLSATGSLSGALAGGLLFGIGMILARGCSSRMLVLAANGNLRALLTGLIFAVTAQASLNGCSRRSANGCPACGPSAAAPVATCWPPPMSAISAASCSACSGWPPPSISPGAAACIIANGWAASGSAS
jgi:hypothetical protein